MKIPRVGPEEIFHRYLTPKWAFLPTSGAGAAIDGGRFNRPGVEALYLSRSAQTALDEYVQGASITPPATLAAYKITLAEVADISQGYDPDVWEDAWQEWNCAWRQIARIDKKVPPSWKLADMVITSGLRGILFPSLRSDRAAADDRDRGLRFVRLQQDWRERSPDWCRRHESWP